MSYEGATEMLCENGHYDCQDCREPRPEKCECGSPIAWFHEIDDTNCDGERAAKEVIVPAVTKCCAHCGHVREVEPELYKPKGDLWQRPSLKTKEV